MNWVPHVFAIEIKKALSYRVAFWVQFVLGTATEIAIAYFLWAAIFASRGVAMLEGFSFEGMVYYYLFATFAHKIARGNEHGYFAQDIYDGGLTRYLVYPISLFGFKYITHVTQQLLAVIQLLLAFLALRLFLGAPFGMELTLPHFFAGLATSFLAGFLLFLIMSCLEMVAFWQDVIWNLMAMLRFTMALLGGAMVPLAFFPDWGRTLVSYTPFPAMISFPARTFLGQITFEEWWRNALLLLLWSGFFLLLARFIWKRGTLRYSGVGL